MGLSRGGKGTKIHLIAEARGLPVGFLLTPGQTGELKVAQDLLVHARKQAPRHRWPTRLAGDKGYSKPAFRCWLKRRHMQVVIPTRKDEDRLGRRDPHFDKKAYRHRNVIERCFGHLKECRRICTRFEKLALNFRAMVTLAIIAMYFRLHL